MTFHHVFLINVSCSFLWNQSCTKLWKVWNHSKCYFWYVWTTLSRLNLFAVWNVHTTKYYEHAMPLFRNSKILKIEDMYKLQLLMFMFSYYINILPSPLYSLFTRNCDIHDHYTRCRKVARNTHILFFILFVRYQSYVENFHKIPKKANLSHRSRNKWKPLRERVLCEKVLLSLMLMPWLVMPVRDYCGLALLPIRSVSHWHLVSLTMLLASMTVMPKFDVSLWPWPLTYTSGPGNMCIKFQINRSTIDDFRNSEKSQLSLTSRDEKTWLRTSTGVRYFRSGFRQRTFCNQLEVSMTSDSKLWLIMCFSCLGWSWPWPSTFQGHYFVWGQHIPISVCKKILNIFCGWVFVIWLYLKKKYRLCDLDLWPMKVNYFLWIDYQSISVLYKFEIDISTNSREIKYLNIEIWVYAFYMLNVTRVKNDV